MRLQVARLVAAGAELPDIQNVPNALSADAAELMHRPETGSGRGRAKPWQGGRAASPGPGSAFTADLSAVSSSSSAAADQHWKRHNDDSSMSHDFAAGRTPPPSGSAAVNRASTETSSVATPDPTQGKTAGSAACRRQTFDAALIEQAVMHSLSPITTETDKRED